MVSVAQLAQEAAEKAASGQSSDIGPAFQGQVTTAPTYEFLRDADQKIAKLEEQVKARSRTTPGMRELKKLPQQRTTRRIRWAKE
jgi:hypothetical protein